MLQVWLARLVSAAHLPQSTSVSREGAAWKTPNAKHQCMQVAAKIMLSPEWLTMRMTWYISLLTATGRTSATRAVHTLKKTPASVNHCINFVQSFIIDFAVGRIYTRGNTVRCALFGIAPQPFFWSLRTFTEIVNVARVLFCAVAICPFLSSPKQP